MLDHVGFKVKDYAASKAFYERVLAPLGYALVMEVTPEMTGTDEYHVGFGPPGIPAFWISAGEVTRGLHVALSAGSRSAVDAFYAAAYSICVNRS